jgi:hypothetical protein
VGSERHASILFGLLEALGTAGNLTTDAHLAALAGEHQAELQSTDADFGRFRGLRWVDPLADDQRFGARAGRHTAWAGCHSLTLTPAWPGASSAVRGAGAPGRAAEASR